MMGIEPLADKWRAFGWEVIDGTLFIRPLQFKSDGGDFWGEGWIKPTEKGIRCEFKPRVSNMEAKAFLRTLFQKGEEEKVEAIFTKIPIYFH
jgi:hypothetical protein